MTDYVQLVTQMLKMFFLAHGFVTVVNLIIFPTTSRDASLQQIRSYLSVASDVLSAEAAYVRSLERGQPQSLVTCIDINEEHGEVCFQSDTPEHVALSKAISTMSLLHGKLRTSVSFAKKDIGWSTMSADDFGVIEEIFRKLVVTLRGMASMMPVFRSLCEGRGWGTFTNPHGTKSDPFSARMQGEGQNDDIDRLEWRAIFSDIQQPVDEIIAIMLEGLRHVSISVGFQKSTVLESVISNGKRNSDSDPESAIGPLPGNAFFVADFQGRLDNFHEKRGISFRKWKDRNHTLHTKENRASSGSRTPTAERVDIKMEQMFVILFMHNLFHHIANIILELAKFTDSKNPGITEKHLVIPTTHRLWKLLRQLGKVDGLQDDCENTGGQTSSVIGTDLARVVSRRTVQKSRRSWRKVLRPVTTSMIKVSKIIGSRESLFGFRVAMAVMSVVLVGLLQPTQTWFYNQRGLWALVFIPYSMAPNSGETISMLLFRLVGSGAAIAVAIVNCEISVNQAPMKSSSFEGLQS